MNDKEFKERKVKALEKLTSDTKAALDNLRLSGNENAHSINLIVATYKSQFDIIRCAVNRNSEGTQVVTAKLKGEEDE